MDLKGMMYFICRADSLAFFFKGVHRPRVMLHNRPNAIILKNMTFFLHLPSFY